jgi:hypothetical protein
LISTVSQSDIEGRLLAMPFSNDMDQMRRDLLLCASLPERDKSGALYAACANGNHPAVIQMLSAGFKAEQHHLTTAVMHGDQAVVDTLLAHGLRMQAVEEFIHANAQDRRTAGPQDRETDPPKDRQETLFRGRPNNAKICTF